MELLQLQYFCEAAKSESFTATAKAHSVPPSAVSQSIKRLEGELSTPLFQRSANRVLLNEQGRLFYEKVSKALVMLQEAKKELCDDGAGRVRLSIFINRRLVMQTVEKFSRLYPNVDIVTKYTTSPDREEFDLIVTDQPPAGAYVGEKLIEEEILLAVHRTHPLASCREITSHALAEAPFVCTNQGSSLYRITQEICADRGFSPRIVICSDDPLYIRKCVELGLGVSLIPAASWQGQFSENVVLRRVGAYRRTTYAYRNTQKYFSKSAAGFLEMLKNEFASEQKK